MITFDHNMDKPKISIIVAMDEERGIGKNNGLLWHIPEELKHFKEITMEHPIIMGRKTFESIGRPLPGRTNIVVTRDPIFINSHPELVSGSVVVHSLNEAIEKARKDSRSQGCRSINLGGCRSNEGEIFIIGGGQIFAAALPLADKLYVTQVEGDFNATVFFPEYEHIFKRKVYESDWQESSGHKFKFLELVK